MPLRPGWLRLPLALLAWLAAALACWPALAQDKVVLQLKHSHQFQFAGYYAALEQGYYREAGLDVQILEGTDGKEPERNVLAGKAQYGVGDSSLLLARLKGKPVVVLGVVFQHSPYALVMAQGQGAPDVHRVVDKRVMIGPLSDDLSQGDELIAYLRKEGIAPSSLQRLEHSYNPDDLGSLSARP